MDLSCFELDRNTGYVANLEFGTWQSEAVATSLKASGFTSVSWSVTPDQIRDDGHAGFLCLKQATSEQEMSVSEVNVEMDLVVADSAERRVCIDLLHAALRCARDSGIKAIKTYTGPVPWNPDALRIGDDISEGNAWESVAEILNQVMPTAEELGVELNIEPVFGHLCHDYYTLRQLLDMVDSFNLGAVFDPSHLFLYDNDIPWSVRQLGQKIRHVHIKDVVGQLGPFPRSFVFPLLGEGQISWGPFMRALIDITYRGVFTIEFESFTYYRRILRSDPERAARISMEHFRDLCLHVENDEEFDGASIETPWMR